MKIGMIGLGKMGYNLALNLLSHQHEVAAYNRSADKIKKIEQEGAIGAYSVEELVQRLDNKPRAIWIMVPAGSTVDRIIDTLVPLLDSGDIIIDGGNSHFKDSMQRYERLKKKGINFLDVGTSGGMEGARYGACTMIGGDSSVFEHLETIFKDISTENGYLYAGPAGSGHFLKMVHNGIEYGMMQAIGEGFEVLQQSGFDYDLQEVARVWSHGSVIRGWLVELIRQAFAKDSHLDGIKGVMQFSGEAQWTVDSALELNVPVPVIATSLFMRFRSVQEDSFTGKVVAALRNEFGGHAVVRGS